ncbi:MAG: hypothetical protein M3Y34_07415 [Actinomycetota bacterium]|nr:hypothetical protein [Actinomycetota bacterium]
MWAGILDRHPTADLKVYVVWLPMLSTDARSRWRFTGHTIDDPRVTHFWDERRVVGRWLAEQAGWDDGDVMWDVYFLYGAEAEWGETPSEPLVRGEKLENEPVELIRRVDALLGGDGVRLRAS